MTNAVGAAISTTSRGIRISAIRKVEDGCFVFQYELSNTRAPMAYALAEKLVVVIAGLTSQQAHISMVVSTSEGVFRFEVAPRK
jgi:hypothetical protein